MDNTLELRLAHANVNEEKIDTMIKYLTSAKEYNENFRIFLKQAIEYENEDKRYECSAAINLADLAEGLIADVFNTISNFDL